LRRIKSPPPAIFLPTHKKPVALAELKSSPDRRNGAMAILPAYCNTKWLTHKAGDIRLIPMEHRRSKHMGMDAPFIKAECDHCGEVTDEMEMTSLAGGGWDARNVIPRLKREGWRIKDDKFTCPDCLDAIEEGAST
jgi:hypothetical protein